MASLSPATAPPAPGSAGAWWRAARPATLPASVVPVAVGSAVAAAERELRPGVAAACLAGAVLLQLASNFVNDYADHARGADGDDRLGPPRAAQQGWLTPAALRGGAALCLVGAAAVGAWLVALGGWPIAVGGTLAVLCAWAYTGGPLPLGYRGLGDPLVFVFFGLFAVAGTHFLQAGTTTPLAWAAALPIGLLATLLLAVNNLRDRAGDERAGKRTVAVRLGEAGARSYACGLLAGAYAALLGVVAAGAGTWALLALGSLPLAAPVWRSVRRAEGAALNVTLARAGRLEAAFGALLALGVVLAGGAWGR